MIERAARLLNSLRKSTVDSLRNIASIADADWRVVDSQTNLKSDFFTAYRYSRWMHNRDQIKNVSKVNPIMEKRIEAIRQINLSEKSGYSKLYSKGMISRESLINLLYLVNNCIKMKRLLEPSDIFKINTSNSFLNKLGQQLAKTITKKPPPIFVQAFVFTFCFIDCLIIVYSIFFAFFDDMISTRLNIIAAHNLLMFTGYLLVVIYCIIRNRSFKANNLWQSLYKIVLLITFIDLEITASPLLFTNLNTERSSVYGEIGMLVGDNYKHIYKLVAIICIFTRFVRIFPVLHILPIFQLNLLNIVTHFQDKEHFVECDMATGYIGIITETLSKLNSIITDKSLLLELKYLCHKNKLEASQYLSLAQIKHKNVIAALKTKNAMRTILNCEENALLELTEMGVLEEQDSDLIHRVGDLNVIENELEGWLDLRLI